jgi:hypothetical protein
MKEMAPMTKEVPATSPRALYRSEIIAAAKVTTYAQAYGGTVNSCASRFSYPSPWTIVGENNEREETPTPRARYVM